MLYRNGPAEFRLDGGNPSGRAEPLDTTFGAWSLINTVCIAKPRQTSLRECNHDYPRCENVAEAEQYAPIGRARLARFSRIAPFAGRGDACWLECR